MNKRAIIYVLGAVLLIGAALMLPPLLVALICHEVSGWYFLWVMLGAAVLGALALRLGGGKRAVMYAKEGLIAVALSWIVLSLVGALPFTLSGQIPFYLDAVFEMISGFTTTGSSILPAVEELDKCMLFWRSFSHWIGGMGILVFMLAIVRMDGGQAIHLLRAESPGPTVSKMVPRMADSSKILYGIYFGLTVLQILFYLAGGEPLLDSLCNAFGTAGTGGFAIKNSSMGGYSYFLQTVVTVFMFLFGVNFSLYYMLLLRKFKAVFKNEELRLYFGIAAGSVVLIAINISRMYNTVYESVHHAAFQVVSIMTTTGYGTVDFEQWPAFSKAILLSLMFIGASAGSTGGGLKVSRVLLLMKSIRRTIRKALHPRRVQPVYMDGRAVSEEVCDNVNAYLAIYCVILVLSFAIISVDGFSIGTNFSAVASCFNNIGPGFELVGATQNFSIYSDLSKIILSLDMLLGRLEIFPLLLLLSPDTWSRRR